MVQKFYLFPVLGEEFYFTEDRRSKDRGTSDRRSKPKRARGKKGRYLGDDLSTKEINEAWVGGKAPKKKKRKK